MTLLKDDTFYWPFPVFGIPINEQWYKIRTDTELLKAFVDSIYYENTDGIRGHAAFAGMDLGEQPFKNRYRIVYIAASNELHAQCNEGTEEVPLWMDIFHLDCDGPFQFVVDRGISIEGDLNLVGDFYGAAIELSLEDGTRSLLTTERVIHLNPDDFYLTQNSQGEPVINIERLSGSSITQVTFTDEINTFVDDTIHFNPDFFYLTRNSLGEPILNSGAVAASSSSPSTWRIQDGVRDYLVDDILHVNQSHFYLDTNTDGNPRLNSKSSQVELSDSRSIYINNNINLNGAQFYLSANADGEPVINFNTAEILGAVTSVTFTDGIKTIVDDFVKFMPDDFYLSLASDGSPVVNAKPRITVKGKGKTTYDDTINFNPDHFYITLASSGEPIVNFAIEPITHPKKVGHYFIETTTVTNGAAASALNLGTKIEDVGNWIHPVETTKLVVPPGVFNVTVSFRGNMQAGGTAPGTTAYFDFQIAKNGSNLIPFATLVRTYPIQQSGLGTSICFTSPPLKVVPGDYFELLVATTNYASNGSVTSTSWLGVWETN